MIESKEPEGLYGDTNLFWEQINSRAWMSSDSL